jgi:hypothetical protein
MIIEAVFVFGLLSALLEAIILTKLPLRVLLRILGDPRQVALIHLFVGIFNLIVHFGTVTGTMSAIVSALASFAVIPLIRARHGYIRREVYYRGFKLYSIAAIR